MTTRTSLFDAAELLDDPEAIAAYAEEVIEEGDAGAYRKALDTIARSLGFTTLAQAAGVPRSTLFRAIGDTDETSSGALRAVLESVSVQPRRDAAE